MMLSLVGVAALLVLGRNFPAVDPWISRGLVALAVLAFAVEQILRLVLVLIEYKLWRNYHRRMRRAGRWPLDFPAWRIVWKESQR